MVKTLSLPVIFELDKAISVLDDDVPDAAISFEKPLNLSFFSQLLQKLYFFFVHNNVDNNIILHQNNRSIKIETTLLLYILRWRNFDTVTVATAVS